jgi:hypothetical protein
MKRAFETFYFRLWLEILSVLSVWVESSLVDCNGDVIIGSDRRTNRDSQDIRRVLVGGHNVCMIVAGCCCKHSDRWKSFGLAAVETSMIVDD